MSNMQTPSLQWRKQKAKLKMMFPQLEDSDFVYEYGNKEAMMTRLQVKTGKTQSELNELMVDLRKKQSGSKRPNWF